MLLDKVRSTIEKNRLLENGDKVICAVSGGADSICMLHTMLALRDEYNLTLYVANVNHLLRGEESDDDSAFVKAVARAADLKLFYREYDVAKIAKERKLGEEECGRELRYEFFEEISQSLGGAKIATAHNINDNAETVLFRLSRGTASHGLCGIMYKRENIIRPLLDVSRKDIEKYLRANSVTWCEDSTNKMPVYARNKLRLGVMPVLREISPCAEEKIVSAARFIAEDDEFIRACANVMINECVINGELILQPLTDAPISLKRRIVAYILEKWCVKEINAEKINSFLEFIGKENGKMFDLNAEYYARKSYGKVMAVKRSDTENFEAILDVGHAVETNEWSLKAFLSDTPVRKNGNSIAVFDAEKIMPPFDVTYRKNGDKIKIKGIAGTKKLSDIFTDEKTETLLRDRIPVVRKADDIVFLCGLRQTSLFAADDSTKKWLIIKYERRDLEYGKH